MAEKQSPMYKKPTDAQRKKIENARKLTRRGMEEQKDFLSKISTTMAKGARDEEKMGKEMMRRIPEPVKRYESEEGAPPMGPYKEGGMVKKAKTAKKTKARSSCDGIAKKGHTQRPDGLMYLTSNIPYFKCWVRKEFTNAHQNYHGEYIHGLAVAVTTIPDRCLSFQIIFTGCEADDGSQENVHGGAMWARMPITALVGDIPLEQWPERMQTHLAQPWDCSSYNHSIFRIQRAQPSPWLCKINNEFHVGRYLFTVDYAESDVAEDPSQHKQSHVLMLTDAGSWTGNIVALPNNRVRVTSPAYWVTGEGAPDFRPSQWIHCAEQDDSYMDPEVTFNNLYKE